MTLVRDANGDFDSFLTHYGILRKSGRYPWGSGGNVPERSKSFLDYVKEMLGLGMTEAEIAKGVGMKTTELRAAKSIAINELKAANIAQAQRLRDKGTSNVEIGKLMNVPESTVRSWLKASEQDKVDTLTVTVNRLRDAVKERGWIDVGLGTENHLGVARTKLEVALAVLKNEGMNVHRVKIPQAGNPGKFTDTKVLVPPGVEWKDVIRNTDKIKTIAAYSEDNGRSYFDIVPPLSISPKRVAVRYAEQGGDKADGVIFVREGVSDLSLGGARYAQVRIAINGTHYLKGMAMYKDDLPDGVDLVFNTNKSDTGNKLDAMKELKADEDNPFGAVIRQIGEKDASGKVVKLTSAMNIVNEEGDWGQWTKSLSSQFLSKQHPNLAKEQLGMTYERRKNELDEIKSLTNPVVRKKLLETFADQADSAAVHLKAAALPNQATRVILPIASMKDNEIYSPSHNDGDRVVLVRFPHGGIFEIPELTVNNRQREAKAAIGSNPKTDAVGISHEVAKRLSGADFDGDTVLVIPNNNGVVKTAGALDGLKDFDPQRRYPGYEGMKVMSKGQTQTEMGIISNLITDMTIQGARPDELAAAVRHSMVVIDANKHKLNYRQSAIDNGILNLKKKYQARIKEDGKVSYGAATIISRAKSPIDVPERKPRSAKEGDAKTGRGPVNPYTGEKVYTPTNRMKPDKNGNPVLVTQKSKKLVEATDARTLSSGTKIEEIYAEHSNKLKALANDARKEAVNTKPPVMSKSAKETFKKEVEELDAALDLAFRNKPLERQAQILTKAAVSAKRAANPDMTKDELKKINRMALVAARNRVGAEKTQIKLTDRQWLAIQAGAVTAKKLTDILDNADLDRVRELATPKTPLLMTSSKISRARRMMDLGYTQAEIASQLGVSLTTLKNNL